MEKINSNYLKDELMIEGIIEDDAKIESAVGYSLKHTQKEGRIFIPIIFNDNSWGYAPFDKVSVIIERFDDSEAYIEDELITFKEMCKKIGISVFTLERWYRWYRNRKDADLENKIPSLPPTVTIKKVKYFYKSNIKQLKKFKDFYKNNWGMMRKEYIKNTKVVRSRQYGYNKEQN